VNGGGGGGGGGVVDIPQFVLHAGYTEIRVGRGQHDLPSSADSCETVSCDTTIRTLGNGEDGGNGGGARFIDGSYSTLGKSTQGDTVWHSTTGYVSCGSDAQLVFNNLVELHGTGGAGLGGLNENHYNGMHGYQTSILGVSEYYAAGGAGGSTPSQ